MVRHLLIATASALIALMGLPAPVSAKPRAPSRGRIKRDLKDRSILSVEIRRRGAGARRARFRAGSRRVSGWIWEATIVIKKRTNMRGVTKYVRGDVVYYGVGRRYRFKKFRYNSEWYKGIKPPQQAEVLKALKIVGWEYALQEYTWKKVVTAHSAKLAANPNITWFSTTHVRLEMDLVYTIKDGRSLKKITERRKLYLKRASAKAAWTSLCIARFDSSTCLSTDANQGKERELSRTSPPNIGRIRTLAQKQKAWRRAHPVSAAQKANRAHKRTGLRVGDRVKARYRCKTKWRKGDVQDVRGYEVLVKYDSGSTERLLWTCMKKIKGDPNRWVFKRGDVVQARYNRGNRWYFGIVQSTRGNKVHVHYFDGSKEWVEKMLVRHAKAAKRRARFRVGQRIRARHKCGTKWYKGRVTKVRGGLIHVHYNDGDKEWLDDKCARR